jgi:hypothetical protein
MNESTQKIISCSHIALSAIEAESQKLTQEINQLCKQAQCLIDQETNTFEGELLLKSKQIQLMIAQKNYNGHKKKKHKRYLFF